ncbi:MAG: DUF362 domain-containing protein, partial [Bacteroidales bacterium]|nr:DUF362 domain-containing protein [Bacteroidales bacterium]
SFSIHFYQNSKESIAGPLFGSDNTFPVLSNDPVGEAKGLYPGRVVWVYDPDATNENYDPVSAGNDWWYSHHNVDQDIVEQMLSTSIKQYAGSDDISEAWEAIFKSFNSSHGNGDAGYTPGEKIAIKINLTNQCCSSSERMDATPQLLNALLHELTVNAGIKESDITLGDPYRDFRDEYVDLVLSEFPNVNYIDGKGRNGVAQTTPSANEVLVFSDKVKKSTLPQYYLDATYLINIPCLKTHNAGGITIIAKNHQGSFLVKGNDPKSQSAQAMHYSLPGIEAGQQKYRHLVDYMGHEQTGGKGLLYIVDGIWAGEDWKGWIKKFKSAPFNNNYPNSILIGQDPVALESVCFDILFEECAVDGTKESYPITCKNEIADYLLQCASSDYWPDNISYDPEGDGRALESLGVFEHWNNETDREYSRNLGTGEGIELNFIDLTELSVSQPGIEQVNFAAPNPFSDYTTFTLPKEISRNTKLEIHDLRGSLVRQMPCNQSGIIIWYGDDSQGRLLLPGLYVYIITDHKTSKQYSGKVNISNR